MATYTESEKVKIRLYLGFSAVFLQENPALENAMTNTLSIADGGSRPDSSTQTAIIAVLDRLDNLETKIQCLLDQVSVSVVDGITMNAGYGINILHREGRRLVTQLSTLLGLRGPKKDIYCASAPINDDDWIFNK